MSVRRDNNVQTPNLGLYLGLSPTAIPRRAMKDCLNVRIDQGKVVFDNLGWNEFPDDSNPVNLDGKPALMIESFVLRDGSIQTIFGNTTDIFSFDDLLSTLSYLTPRYETGTASVTDGSPIVDGVGTTWLTNVKAGDFFSFGATETDPTAIWYEVLSIGADNELTLTVDYDEATAGPSDYTIRQVFTGDIGTPWFTETFYNGVGLGGPVAEGDRWYATNGRDPVIAWDGSADVVYLPALGNVDTCAVLLRHKNKMIYFAPTVSGSFEKFSMRTSDIGNPEDTVTGEAAELIVHDGPDQIQTAKVIGELIAIYSEKNITLAQSVTLPLVYLFRTVVTGYGPSSRRGVAVYPDFHDFVGSDRQYRFNGSTIVPVNNHVWRDVIRRITPERNNFLLSHFDEERGELLWVTPLTTDADTENGPPEECFTNHYMEDVGSRAPDPHTRRNLPALVLGSYERQTTLTWDQISQEWQNFSYRWNDRFFFAEFPLTLFGDENGNIFILNGDTTQNGVLMDNFVRFARVAVGTIEFKGIIKRIYPFIEQLLGSTDTVQVRLYGSDTLNGVATLLSDQSFSTGIPTEKHFVSPRKSARYVEIEIGVDQGINFWSLVGYAIDTVPGSAR